MEVLPLEHFDEAIHTYLFSGGKPRVVQEDTFLRRAVEYIPRLRQMPELRITCWAKNIEIDISDGGKGRRLA